jgi:hypothetical protein
MDAYMNDEVSWLMLDYGRSIIAGQCSRMILLTFIKDVASEKCFRVLCCGVDAIGNTRVLY